MLPPLLLETLLLLLSLSTQVASASMALKGCPDKCDNITVIYPFGTTRECSKDEGFLLTCNSSVDPPRLSLETPNSDPSQFQVTSLNFDTLTISYPKITRHCFPLLPGQSLLSETDFNLGDLPYTLSSDLNRITVIGCDSVGVFSVNNESYSGCLTICSNTSVIHNGTCSGEGCCQGQLKKGAKSLGILVESLLNHTTTRNISNCTVAFPVQHDWYNFSYAHLANFTMTEAPVVLEWAIGDESCEVAKTSGRYACKGKTKCVDSASGKGYRCHCKDGYEGNPYLQDGCRAIDECARGRHSCSDICINEAPGYTCSCPEGMVGDGWRNGTRCQNKNKGNRKNFQIGLAVFAFMFVALVISPMVILKLRRENKRENSKVKERCFRKNGGLLLLRELSAAREDEEIARLFNEDELKKATDGYSEKQILGKGANGKVYRATLQDQSVVAIKISKLVDEAHVEQFINEIMLLSKVVHRNVVKFVGCCLETMTPMLVYEYISHGTLFEHIHEIGYTTFLPWQLRLRIATETALAIAHLHSGLDRPIIHRDIKSANILLDADLTAKVADFGSSRFAPLDEHDEATMVVGTRGYLDPEYLEAGLLSDKSDVYSFGVVLAELLTGKKAIWYNQTGVHSLVTYIQDALREGRLLEILDARVRRVGNVQQTTSVADIARRCLERNPKLRPSMRQVAAELEMLRGCSTTDQQQPQGGGADEVIDHNNIIDGGRRGERVISCSRLAADQGSCASMSSPFWSMDLPR